MNIIPMLNRYKIFQLLIYPPGRLNINSRNMLKSTTRGISVTVNKLLDWSGFMHMADALVSPAVAGTTYALSATAAAYSVKKTRPGDNPAKIPVMGVMGAFVFAAQMINFTIPGTGSSGHLCGGILLSAILGPFAGFLAMISVLVTQCLLFADGGLLALGCNIWNMAFYSCFAGMFFIWKPLMKNGISRAKIIAASLSGCIISLQLGAFSVSVETFVSGISGLPFIAFVAAMQPVHLATGLVEGLITAAVLVFIYEARPEMLYMYNESVMYTSNTHKKNAPGRFTYKKTIIILALATILTGGVFSLAASGNPDGLEWSLGRMKGYKEDTPDGTVYIQSEKVQETTALLPDYAFKNTDKGTSFSGIIGSIIVMCVCAGICYIFRFCRKKGQENGQDRKSNT